VLHFILVASLAAVTLQTPAPQTAPPQTPPSTAAAQAQADGQAALQGMAHIYTVLGSCERHFTREQIRGVRQVLEPERGQVRTPLQTYLDDAYQSGKSDQTWTAPMCQDAMRMLADSRTRPQ
jgi:hypothetical protein